MDETRFIRVKLQFRKKVKVTKLESRVDTALTSMENLKKLIYKNFSEVRGMVEPARTSDAGAMVLSVKYLDSAGDFVTLENDGDLEVARENRPKRNELKFKIDLVPRKSSPVAAPVPVTVGRSRYRGSRFRVSGRIDAAHSGDLATEEQACRNFARGHCRNGPTCRFPHKSTRTPYSASSSSGPGNWRGRGSTMEVHDDSSNVSPFRHVQELDYWLMNQLSLAPWENIEQLSEEKGLRVLSQVVERRNLSTETISLFVKVLVKDEVRTSLLREKTNKIYGVLLGSPFLLQLHGHITSQLGNPTRAPKAPHVRPYLLLTEELQSRTADGWKEVPLDALQSVVLRLEQGASKDELVAIVSRLMDQRANLQRLMAVAPADKCLQGAEFRKVSIVPDKEELFRFQARQDLPVNRIGMRYARLSDYVETHFQLLREDCIDPLRQGIRAYRNNTNGNDKPYDTSTQELRIYTGVRLVAVRCGDQGGVVNVLSFDLPANEKDTKQWESSKKLMSGALLCISSDHFQSFVWGIVARRDVKELARGLVGIRLIGESDANVSAGLQSWQTSTETFVMVESTAAYFEAYYHVMMTLQRVEMEDIPFTNYLLHLEPKVSPPSYLLRRKSGDEYDFSDVFPNIQRKFGRKTIRITQSAWPSGWADSLDSTQQEALKHGLTKELAIIQGPPGTGKTFLGLLIVKLLLANLRSHDLNRRSQRQAELDNLDIPEVNVDDTYDMSGPIFVICYTNHALDQFLEGIYRGEEKNVIIRIGGRSKSELLKENSLQSLLKKQREARKVVGSHHRFFCQGRDEESILEDSIHKGIDEMGKERVTCAMLDGVATPEQIESLFWIPRLQRDGSSERIVELWLTEEWCTDPFLARHFFVNENPQDHIQRMGADYRQQTEAKAEEKPSRGRMKPLPNQCRTQIRPLPNDQWTRVWRRGRGRRQAALDGPDERLQLVDDNPERHDDMQVDTVDHGAGRNALPALEGDGNNVENAPDLANEGGLIDEDYRLEEFVNDPDVWRLNLVQRKMLHNYWIEEIRANQRRKLRELTQKYEEACKNVKEVEDEIQLSMLRKADIIGMTTTAAAKYYDVLKSLKPEIIIVEEAAEVLEGHILACLGPSVKHLILIGDHLQLRPSVAVYRLSTEHKLDISMFERLVKSGIEHVTLQEQRRMRPSISKLMRNLYPKSRDHESVTHYEDVRGVKSNVFFFDHKATEDNVRDASSKFNLTEAKLVVEFCLYLLNQGYEPKNIAILSMYSCQLVEIKTLLSQRCRDKWYRRAVGENSEGQEPDLPRVSSVDDYQGEESDITILSLVRSNAIVSNDGVGKIGFLRTPNRICVALTRARQGLFIFGNADLLAEKSTLWNDVTTSMRNDGELGPELELYCQNHPHKTTKISSADDFKQVEDGGCSLPCELQLECGHACPRRCHPGPDHGMIVCPKPCRRQYNDCPHVCNLRCHGSEACPPCEVVVTKQMPNCNHQQAMKCSADVKDEFCRSNCPKVLQCGHHCVKACGRPCTTLCEEKVVKVLPCGHSARMLCHKDPATYSCDEPCKEVLQSCQHECGGKCGLCKQGTAHIPCQKKCSRILPCGHPCQAKCSLVCPPCRKKCPKRCFHSRCSELCGNVCRPCREPCSWQCEHHKCEKSCWEICTRPRCDLPCPKRNLKCGHRCIGLCGEPCPKKCRVCHPDTLDVITRMTLEEFEDSDKFVQLEDCGHIFEVSGLDTWMDLDQTAEQQAGSVAIKLKECPECRTPIWRSHRYSNVVKKKHFQVEEVKKRMRGHEKTRKGNLLLERGDEIDALSAFQQALQDSPGLMEAHFGAGRAFCKRREYDKAVAHLSFIVERSSFSSGFANLILSARGCDHAVNLIDKCYGSSGSRAGDLIAKQAMVQWAVALAKTRKFTLAMELCNAVLGTDPENRQAAEVKAQAEKGEVRLVVEVMAAEVGERGHWYTCPNGHYYCIGECGGAMQVSKCPDCKAEVGGQQHRLTAGNRHANIDGSGSSAWPGN